MVTVLCKKIDQCRSRKPAFFLFPDYPKYICIYIYIYIDIDIDIDR